MREARVKKDELVEVVTEARNAHRMIFEKALEGYHKKVVEELEKRLEDARNGVRYIHHVALIEPQDHTDDFDRALRMLSMEVSDEVVLSEGEFAQLVMNEWSWAQQFAASTQPYL